MFIIYNEAIDKAMREDPYIPPPSALTLTATTDNSSVKLIKEGTLSNEFEVNVGNGWEAYTFDTVIPLNAGQSCKWRCSAHPTTQGILNYVKFVMTGTIEASGSCNSMLSSDFENLTSLSGYDFALTRLFQGCASLTKPPLLPATTLSRTCYFYMFQYCTGLTQAPVLPATMLAYDCYNSMFGNCTSLAESPALPATALAAGCYRFMFEGCTSLTKAPVLLATTLANSCYKGMFDGCSSLNEVRCQMPSSYSSDDVVSYAETWLEGVSATGTFHTNEDANWTSGASGIPTGWTRLPLSEYPTT